MGEIGTKIDTIKVRTGAWHYARRVLLEPYNLQAGNGYYQERLVDWLKDNNPGKINEEGFIIINDKGTDLIVPDGEVNIVCAVFPKLTGRVKSIETLRIAANTSLRVTGIEAENEAAPGGELKLRVNGYNNNDEVDVIVKRAVLWTMVIDGKEEDLQDQQGEKIAIPIKAEWAGKEIEFKAYINRYENSASISIHVVKWELPMLIIQGRVRKGKAYIMANDIQVSLEETARDLLYNDYEEKQGLGFNKLFSEIYRKAYEEYQDEEKKQRLGFSKFSYEMYKITPEHKAEICVEKIKSFSKKNDEELFAIFESDAITWYSMGSLENAVKQIIEKTRVKDNGPINEYSFPDLTKAVEQHDKTNSFVSSVRSFVKKHIKENNNNLLKLQIHNNECGAIYEDMVRNGVGKLKFDGFWEIISGLRITLNDVWAYQVYISEYTINNNEARGKLRFDLYDHFGLDYPDIMKYDNDIFIAWFILQHFRGYKPFMTKISFEKEF